MSKTESFVPEGASIDEMQAAFLDAQYGTHPDLAKKPVYGVVFSFRDSFDAEDIRTTGGTDLRYDVGFPAPMARQHASGSR